MKLVYVLFISYWFGVFNYSSCYGMDLAASDGMGKFQEEDEEWDSFFKDLEIVAPPGAERVVRAFEPIVFFTETDYATMCEEYSSASEERKEEIKEQLLSCGYELLETTDGGAELQPTLNKAMRNYATDFENRDVYDAVLKKHGLKAQETALGRFCFTLRKE